MLLVFTRRKLIAEEIANRLLDELESICRMIVSFANKLDN